MLILASSSPRRSELLRNARIVFKVIAAEVAEVPDGNESPRDFAQRAARDKARAVYQQMPSASRSSNLVLAADTVVVVDGAILGKPADEQDAARMLRLLSGRSHQVITGVCLIGAQSDASTPEDRKGSRKPKTGNQKLEPVFEDVSSEITNVYFNPLSDADINEYIATGEPMDKAGAYAIQGVASRWIPRIEGCYFNVVGLPVPLVCRMLREHGKL
ncbi:MAG: nucleoside triphosphate pyrophosphatase [Terriglobales bacterium]